jgi:hypothetical protein
MPLTIGLIAHDGKTPELAARMVAQVDLLRSIA